MDSQICKVFSHPEETRPRFRELGLSEDILRTVAEAAHLAYVSRTDNDPPFIPGTNAWAQAVRRLRECLIKEGWRKDDPGNYSLTISDKHRINIVVASGDNATGQKDSNQPPSTKSIKGIKTELAVRENKYHGDMFKHLLPENIQLAEKTARYQTWFLLIHVTDEFVRYELSLPSEIEQGHITEWRERIIMPEISGDPGEVGDEHDEQEDIDVPIVRRPKN